MSSIESLGISGIRGYTSQNYQRIEFMKPLTLIWGKNGSGKTTIIECLKYITTGSLPPNSDKGKSFIMDTKVAGKPEVIGDIRFIFKVGNRAILVKRRIQLSAKGQQLKFQSVEQVLKTKGQNGQDLTINHQCAQIEKQVPQFLGISKPILENIVFCHQDESLWPFGDSLLLKNIFDQLFQTKKITKEMEKLWEAIKTQQTQLKEQKIRIQFQKNSFKKQLDERSRYFLQLQEIELKSKELKETKKTIKKLKQSLKDNTDKVKQREKLIYKKGRIQNSISNSQAKLKTWKENVYRIQKEFDSKMKGKNVQLGGEENPYGISSRSHSIGSFNDLSMTKIPQSELQKVKMIRIQTPEKSIEQLEFKKSVFESLKEKYREAKQQHENIKNFTESSKREQEINSQIERVKSLAPELKYNKDIKNDQDFLRLLKSRISEMQSKIKGKQIAKRKLQKMQIPAVVQMGFSDKQIQQLKRESKQLQSDIKSSSLTILKIYQVQYKATPSGLPIQRMLSQFQTLQKQVHNTEAILKSKQQELQEYIKLQQENKSQKKDNNALQNDYSQYKYAGIELPQEMLHFCQKRGKCYFCQKQMTKKQIEQARQKVNLTKKKTEIRLRQIENQMQNQGQITIDPQIMVKKLTEEVNKLNLKLQMSKEKFSKLKQAKLYQKQIQLNKSLSRQLEKCNLNIDMLQKLNTSASQSIKLEQSYRDVSIQKFVQMCSQHQIRMTRYKGIKDQISKLQINQQKNQLNKINREQIIKDKKQLEQQIAKTEEQVRHFEFLRNSLQKLEPLVKMETKSKQKKVSKQGTNGPSGQNSSSQGSFFFSAEQAAHAMNHLYMQILQEKVYIQKLQISINYHNDRQFLQEQKKQYHEVIKELEQLTIQLKTSQETLNRYNTTKAIYEKQCQRAKVRLSAITQFINEPMQSSYLPTLTKIKHLQASITNLQLLYYLMEDAVSKYHSQKMEEINQYIYEVWREIYHGEDIDYIEIEASSDQNSKKKKKNYHYRILMKKSTKNFKNQEKVEMKGRCSTGQKVLASIVIRLALAEVFCSNSRILALDEPTTNLDNEHIRNLAKALLRLIEISGGNNLQLIIISHDIEFIQLLESYAEHYYEVKRDENRFSTITKKLIKEMLRDPKPIS